MKCNICGKEILFNNGIPKEDFLYIKKDWGYFSKKDGETHEIIFCEDCYDHLNENLPISAIISQTKEFL